MFTLIEILVLIARTFVAFKFAYLLFQTQLDPESYKIDSLYWYVCYFVGDLWLIKINQQYVTDDKEKEEKKEEEN